VLKTFVSNKLLLLAAVLLLAAPAFAAPVNYNLDTGNIQVQAFNSVTNALVFDETLTLSTNSFLVFDPTGVPTVFGLGTLDDFSFEIDPNQGPYTLSDPFGPYENITIESASIAPGAGYANLITTSFVAPNIYDIQAGPLGFSAFFGATDDDLIAPPLSGAPANLIPNANLTGSITLLGPSQIQVSSNTFTMATVDGDPFGETADLRLDVNIFFAGSEGAVIPEPGTGGLTALGLAGLAVMRRGRRKA
jgi:hypothetical protein